MLDYPIPEILRVPLETISLSVKITREDADVKVRYVYPTPADGCQWSFSAFLKQSHQSTARAGYG